MNDSFLHIEELDAYARQDMNPEQRQSFEARLASDAALRAEWEDFQQLLGAVTTKGDLDLRARIGAQHTAMKAQGLTAQRSSGPALFISHWRNTVLAAAAVVTLLLGAWWFWQANYSDPYAGAVAAAMDASPSQRLPNLLDAMEAPGFGQAAGTDISALRDGLQAYETKNYALAADKLNAYLQTGAAQNQEDARFFLALSQLALDKPAAAVPLLRTLLNTPDAALRRDAVFYLGLAYCRPPLHKEEARVLLQEVLKDAGSPYHGPARQMLDALDK